MRDASLCPPCIDRCKASADRPTVRSTIPAPRLFAAGTRNRSFGSANRDFDARHRPRRSIRPRRVKSRAESIARPPATPTHADSRRLTPTHADSRRERPAPDARDSSRPPRTLPRALLDPSSTPPRPLLDPSSPPPASHPDKCQAERHPSDPAPPHAGSAIPNPSAIPSQPATSRHEPPRAVTSRHEPPRASIPRPNPHIADRAPHAHA